MYVVPAKNKEIIVNMLDNIIGSSFSPKQIREIIESFKPLTDESQQEPCKPAK